MHNLESVAVFVTMILLAFFWARDRRRLVIFRDQLKLAAEAQKTQSHLLMERASLDSLKDEFVATVSHELRTPLTSIHGALRLLTASLPIGLEPRSVNLLRIAVSNTDRLIRLTSDILDLQRRGSGQAPVQMRRCSMVELAQHGIETMSAAAEAAQVQLHLVAAERGQPDLAYFDGDSDGILQIVTNLLSNAIKFSPAGASVRVHVSSRATSVLLRVDDQGRGIPQDKLELVFDRFQQVSPSDAHQQKGTGLGLAICRTIVQQHDGTIWAQPNESGIGTSFWVELPRSGRVTDGAVNPSATLVGRAQGTILVCDDDVHARAVASDQLRRLGYTVLEAESGEQALDIANSRDIQLILLDLYMPTLSGWEILRRLRAATATTHIPVVILSVLPRQNPPTARRIFGQTVVTRIQGWVQKPFDEHNLAAEVQRALDAGHAPTRILFAGADQVLASAVLSGLEQPDIVVHHAPSRQAAIEYCLQFHPDLLILDLGLPDGDGFSLVSWLRGQPGLRALPLVVYSGRAISDSEKTQLQLGPTQFLTKSSFPPSRLDELALGMVRQTRASQAGESLTA